MIDSLLYYIRFIALCINLESLRWLKTRSFVAALSGAAVALLAHSTSSRSLVFFFDEGLGLRPYYTLRYNKPPCLEARLLLAGLTTSTHVE